MTLFGLLKKKQCWCLTLRARMLLIGAAAAGMAVAGIFIHPFLALQSRVEGDILVVEGWLPDYALGMAASEFTAHPYKRIVTIGGPLENGFYLAEFRTYAELSAAGLVKLGVNPGLVTAVPAPSVVKDRTYTSFRALKQWIDRSGLQVRSLNVFTLGTHARRSRLLCRMALKNAVPVGIISARSSDYDPRRWWRTSSGVNAVLHEIIACLYTKLFFTAPDSGPPSPFGKAGFSSGQERTRQWMY